MSAVVTLLALGLAAAPAAAAVDVDLRAYTSARQAGVAGGVAGQVYVESRKPSGADTPLSGAAVVAVPRSEALVRRLSALREGARDSAPAFRQAATLMRRERERYEQALSEAGAADLVHSTVADDAGRFDLANLPEGRWVVLVTWDEFVSARGPKPGRKEREKFVPVPQLLGFRARMLWLQEVDIVRAGRAELRLNDRNVWFNGVVEERGPDAGSRR